MLRKPNISSLLLNSFNKLIRHEHSCTIFYVYCILQKSHLNVNTDVSSREVLILICVHIKCIYTHTLCINAANSLE